ncbi:MAG TPA: GNAT family protein [Mycobacteriales bacterium]|nr:GNAT family protein [Mycobacteriales bacterium]
MTRLRPVTAADVAFLDRQHEDPDAAGEFNWYGYREPTRGRLADRVERGETVHDDGGLFAVVDDSDEVVGDVSWRIAQHGPPPFGDCWNIGIWLAPEARGQGHGSRAQRLIAEYLFANSAMERVEAGTEAGNIGEQKALEKAGFTREGVLRRACLRAGEYRDMVVYSKLRNEP